MTQRKSSSDPRGAEEALDREVDDTFPASDPPSFNPGSASPTREDDSDDEEDRDPERREAPGKNDDAPPKKAPRR